MAHGGAATVVSKKAAQGNAIKSGEIFLLAGAGGGGGEGAETSSGNSGGDGGSIICQQAGSGNADGGTSSQGNDPGDGGSDGNGGASHSSEAGHGGDGVGGEGGEVTGSRTGWRNDTGADFGQCDNNPCGSGGKGGVPDASEEEDVEGGGGGGGGASLCNAKLDEDAGLPKVDEPDTSEVIFVFQMEFDAGSCGTAERQ